MSNSKFRITDRLLAIALAVVLVVSLIPASVFAETPATMTTDLESKTVINETPVEFTVSVTGNDDTNKGVRGVAGVNPAAVSSLRWKNPDTGVWEDALSGFGGTGYLLPASATYTFEVTFRQTGHQELTLSFVDETEAVLCSAAAAVDVTPTRPVITSTFETSAFSTELPTEFTIHVDPKGYAGQHVTAEISVSDPGKIISLKVKEGGSWVNLPDCALLNASGVDLTEQNLTLEAVFTDPVAMTLTARIYADSLPIAELNQVVMVQPSRTVTVNTNEGGTVKVNDRTFTHENSGTNLRFGNNAIVDVTVTPDAGYRLASFVVDGTSLPVDPSGIIIPGFVISGDTVFTASFEKIYKVTVTANGSSGTVVSDPLGAPGEVTVVAGDSVKVTATPTTPGYRVSDVKVNGADEAFPNKGENDASFEKTFTVDQNLNVDVTFAPNRYNITVSAGEHGTATVQTPVVEYNGTATVVFTPEAGYDVELVNVDGVEAGDMYDPSAHTLTIPNVTKNIAVTVKFSGNTYLDLSSLSGILITGEIGRFNDGAVVVLAPSGSVSYTTNERGVQVQVNGSVNRGGTKTKTVTLKPSDFANDFTVTKISVTLPNTPFASQRTYEINPALLGTATPNRFLVDTQAPTVTFDPAEDAGKFYNGNALIYFTVDEGEISAGIQSVEAWLVSDDVDIAESHRTCYTNTDDSYRRTFEDSFLVNGIYNTDNNVIHVKVTDRSGNAQEYTYKVQINTTVPTVTADCTTEANTGAYAHYYTAVTGTVEINDRASTFNQENANNAIHITAVDVQGNPIPFNKEANITWNHVDNKHTATITFPANANYTFSVGTYTNRADVSSAATLTGAGYDGEFTIDTQAPTGKIKLDDATYWESILSALTFGIWKNDSFAVIAEGTDNMGSMKPITYAKLDITTAVTAADLMTLAFSSDPVVLEKGLDSDQKFVAYARLEDLAGNVTFVGTNGIVFDCSKSEVKVTPDAPNPHGFYTGDVNVAWEVSDQLDMSLAYSGIKTVDYAVYNGDTVTDSGNLFTFAVTDPTYDQLVPSASGSFVVSAADNNADHIHVVVTAEDNAGNVYTNDTCYLNILTTAPTATIRFASGEAAPNVVDGSAYFAAPRTATYTIVDRSSAFDAAAATAGIVITAVDITGSPVADAYTLSAWENDGDTHTITITFASDAYFTWSEDYTNLADLALDPAAVDTAGVVAPYAFTVDTVAPSVEAYITGYDVWTTLLETLTFGLYSKTEVTVGAQADDMTSPFTLSYYKEYENPETLVALGKAELDTKTFVPYTGEFDVSSDEAFVVYVKAQDYAGNYSYVSTNGMVVDMTESTVVLTAEPANENGIYNHDVAVHVAVTDAEPYSGIKDVQYYINAGVPDIPYSLFAPAYSNPTYSELYGSWNGDITVDAALNNRCDVVVHVDTVDNAGNWGHGTATLDIDVTSPAIAISFDNNSDNGGNGYFNADRTATVVITERTHHFDPAAATAGITITAKDFKGSDVESAYTISGWTTTAGGSPDEDTHTATIHFAKDANYTFAIAYTDKAGNPNTAPDTGASVAPYIFTVDTTPPTGTVTAASVEGRSDTWSSLVSPLTFGYWSRQGITLSGTSEDATSPVTQVLYYNLTANHATDGTAALTAAQLDAIAPSAWKTFDGFTATANRQFTTYIKIVDKAGNYTYISTDGLIVDDRAPAEELIAPQITVTPPQPINGIYNKDVRVDLKVVDPMVGGTYSGLRLVQYTVKNLGAVTQTGTLQSFGTAKPAQSQLVPSWSGSITVDAAKNNSNDVVIEIYAEDNAGNSSKSQVSIKIDITAPEIHVTYDNNAADSGKYFRANRTAVIEITERNFEPNDVIVHMTNTHGAVPTLMGWTKREGTGNGDNTTWTATVTYAADGDYTFDMDYTDLAGNHCPGVNYGGSVAPQDFTIDKTLPEITVTYDNNKAANGFYYDGPRTATVVVKEHNFTPDRVQIALTATDDGETIDLPQVSAWENSGDSHTVTIAYLADAEYTFDITCTDMAGNAAADFEQQTFVVDTVAPELEITGVEHESANAGDVIPVVSYSDTNLNEEKVLLSLFGANRKEVTPDGTYTEIHNGQVFTFKSFPREKEMDDIYTLSVSVTDLAGNITEQVVRFSINRFGSTYAMSPETEAMVGKYVQNPVDVVITEVNPNELSYFQITVYKNNETILLTEGTDYTVEFVGGQGDWCSYTYTVFAKNFADDGVYRLAFHSEDAAGNVAENTLETKDAEINFGVDKTAPIVSMVNLEDGKTYASEKWTVSMVARDNLVLSSLTVYLDDYNKAYKTWTAEEIAATLASGGEFSFDIPGDSTKAHKVLVTALDAAGNETQVETTGVYVTLNIFVRYFNNKPLFFGSLAALLAAAGTAGYLVSKKKKKENE